MVTPGEELAERLEEYLEQFEGDYKVSADVEQDYAVISIAYTGDPPRYLFDEEDILEYLDMENPMVEQASRDPKEGTYNLIVEDKA